MITFIYIFWLVCLVVSISAIVYLCKSQTGKSRFLALLFFIPVAGFSQQVGFHFDYADRYHLGAGIEGGVFKCDSYFGANTQIYFSRQRNYVVTMDAKYGYRIGDVIPFVCAGYYTSGGEAVKAGEGISGIELGGGISYQFRDSPLKISLQLTNVSNNISFALVRDL